jgi:anthranilate synthase/aminodeoxychorismate synthase-like glutamine amidotransferase
MLLIIDNYDSFTYNLYQYLGEMGVTMDVVRNDKATVAELAARKPEKLLVSPGPCSPTEAGISCAAIEYFAGKIPIFGVCLGHQCIGQVFGGRIIRARRLMHGKTSPIHHNECGLFAGVPNPFDATRYHSLLIEAATCPACLDVTARADEDEIMAVQHAALPIVGVQFHPESIATAHGKVLLKNFLAM